ncbi:MAG: ankyrin repeat domain-containing protein [Proteobacteria bacterium]|nr:ankyrin repeat domain-containing protein [Pseudomonadota bacterium]
MKELLKQLYLKVTSKESVAATLLSLILLALLVPASTALIASKLSMVAIKLCASIVFGPSFIHLVYLPLSKFLSARIKPQYRQFNEADNQLIEACQGGDLKSVKQALKNGAYVNCRFDGKTPLHYACDQQGIGFQRIAGILLAHGADALAKDKYGLIPLHYAARHANHEMFDLFKDIKVPSLSSPSIFDYPKPGLKLEAQGIGETPLVMVIQAYDHKVSAERKKAAVNKLIALGANLNIRCEIHMSTTSEWYADLISPLGVCIRKTLELLCDHTYDNNANDLTRAKAMMELCKILMENGANPMAQRRIYQKSGGKYEYYKTAEMLDSIDANNFGLMIRGNEFKELKGAIEKAAQTQNTEYNAKDFANANTEEEIAAAIEETAIFHKLGAKNAFIKLANVFLESDPVNMAGLETVLNYLTVQDRGYAHIHNILANQYFQSAGAVFDEAFKEANSSNSSLRNHFKRDVSLLKDSKQQKEVNEYRKLCLKHCLMGLLTQEREGKSKIAAIQLLNKLLTMSIKEWSLETLEISENEMNSQDDVMGWIAEKLIEITQFKAQAHHGKNTSSEPGKTYLPSQGQLNADKAVAMNNNAATKENSNSIVNNRVGL